MKYMLLIYMGENAMTEGERQQCYKDSTQLAHDLHAEGKFVSAGPLQPVATATSVRVREGKRLVTDGPFAEAKEFLAGYWIVEVPSAERAFEIAAKASAAPGPGGAPLMMPIEVREVRDAPRDT